MKTKGQAAIEFIMTYGWALLIVLVAIGALATFGVLSPTKQLSDKCIFNNNFICADYTLDTTELKIVLINSFGQTVYNPSVQITDPEIDCTVAVSSTWGTNVKNEIVCDVKPLNLVEKNKQKINLILTYQKYTDGYNHTSQGEVYTVVKKIN